MFDDAAVSKAGWGWAESSAGMLGGRADLPDQQHCLQLPLNATNDGTSSVRPFLTPLCAGWCMGGGGAALRGGPHPAQVKGAGLLACRQTTQCRLAGVVLAAALELLPAHSPRSQPSLCHLPCYETHPCSVLFYEQESYA